MPTAAAVAAAGAPPGTNPLGQPVTLFACTDIMRQREDGSAVLPLFFAYDEAQEAVAGAIAADGAGIKGTSLGTSMLDVLRFTLP